MEDTPDHSDVSAPADPPGKAHGADRLVDRRVVDFVLDCAFKTVNILFWYIIMLGLRGWLETACKD